LEAELDIVPSIAKEVDILGTHIGIVLRDLQEDTN
jgi:hypothetical protein